MSNEVDIQLDGRGKWGQSKVNLFYRSHHTERERESVSKLRDVVDPICAEEDFVMSSGYSVVAGKWMVTTPPTRGPH
jgi:hypothetical protein